MYLMISPMPSNPISLQTTAASASSQVSEHTVPQCSWKQSSTLPSLAMLPPTSLTSPLSHSLGTASLPGGAAWIILHKTFLVTRYPNSLDWNGVLEWLVADLFDLKAVSLPFGPGRPDGPSGHGTHTCRVPING